MTQPWPTARLIHSVLTNIPSTSLRFTPSFRPSPSSRSEIPSQTCSVWSRGVHHVRARKPTHLKKRKGPKSLKDALLLAAAKNAIPALYVDASDISFTTSDPFTWAVVSVDEDQRLKSKANQTTTRVLQRLLADLIVKHATPSTSADRVVQFTPGLSEADATTLRTHGYDESDLHTWMTILTTRDSFHAAQLLTRTSESTDPPPFVYLYLLRRRHITPPALRLLIQHMPGWYRSISIFHQDDGELPSIPKHAGPDLGDVFPASDPTAPAQLQSTAFRALIRLLRHTRRVWPEALEIVTAHFLTLSPLSPDQELGLSHDARASYLSNLTALMNRALYLLAEPAAVLPFKNGVYQEAAQALVLRHMAEHEPPLIITREGYRGVTRVQLAKVKTRDEIEWARLKAPSWPPWKEDRTGMDADIGLDHGISRARQVLDRMQEAGYPPRTWERTALIYAGWDTDHSPTIQTRALMPAPSNAPNDFHTWAGRIRSTRSVHQAWAAFLAYEDKGLPQHQDIYLAMFEKLVAEVKRLRFKELRMPHPSDRSDNIREDRDSLYPGDVKEIFPPPTSSHQAIYTRTEPPSVAQLHQHMIQHDLLPSGRLLAYLIDNSQNMSEVQVYLESSREVYPLVQLSAMMHFQTAGLRLDAIPDSVFTAYVRFLCRFPHTVLERPEAGPKKFDFGAWDLDLRQPLARAICLLVQERRQYRPAWNALLEGFARRKAPTVFLNWKRLHMHDRDGRSVAANNPQSEALDKLVAFEFARSTLSVMTDIDLTLDTVGFKYFCVITEHAARASRAVLDEHERKAVFIQSNSITTPDDVDERLLPRAEDLSQQAPYIRSQFWTLVSVGHRDNPSHASGVLDDGPSLPRLLTTPNPAILHQYIRALGFLRDYIGLRELLQWMVEYQAELSERKAEDRNGDKMMRRVIVSLRVFLEGTWERGIRGESEEQEDDETKDRADTERIYGAPTELLGEVSELVDGVEEWGGWAEDEEVLAYMDRM